jgi:pilus assembly protein CpaE
MVLNMADRVSGLAVRDVEGVVGMRVNAVVPRSTEVPLAGNRGESILLAKKPGHAAKAIQELVKRLLLDEMGGTAEGKGAGKKGRRRGVQA